jgi:hypothetical protein
MKILINYLYKKKVLVSILDFFMSDILENGINFIENK